MIKKYEQFLIKESMSNFDLTKLVTIIFINKDDYGNWIYTSDKKKSYILPKEQVNILSLIDDKFANFVNSGHPITKYFETDESGEVITYAANFAVDIVALKEGRVYLIERADGRGWALPGGFIDAGETEEEAAIREFKEETRSKTEDIISIESLGIVKANDSREINSYTYPFIFHMKASTELKYGDDAKNGKWLFLSRAIKNKLAFTHHTEILKKVDY